MEILAKFHSLSSIGQQIQIPTLFPYYNQSNAEEGKTEASVKLMKRLLLLLTFFGLMQTVCQAYDDILEVEVGEIFTVNGGSYSHIQAVLWDFDPAVFETVSVHEYSTRGKFKAISPSPSAGSVIQATIYYYKSGTTSSGVNKAVASWKVYVADDGSESTVSLPSSMSMQEGQTKTVKATTSSNKYSGKYKWTTSNHYIREFGIKTYDFYPMAKGTNYRAAT